MKNIFKEIRQSPLALSLAAIGLISSTALTIYYSEVATRSETLPRDERVLEFEELMQIQRFIVDFCNTSLEESSPAKPPPERNVFDDLVVEVGTYGLEFGSLSTDPRALEEILSVDLEKDEILMRCRLLLWDDLTGASIGNSSQPPSEDYIFSFTSSQFLSINDLAGFSDDELIVMRNELFARNGYKFQSERFKEMFAPYSWHSPTINDSADVLEMMTPAERWNFGIIVEAERSRPSRN